MPKIKVELLGNATKREIYFDCPECGNPFKRWINKKAETDAEKLIHKVVIYCWTCNAMLTVDEVPDA